MYDDVWPPASEGFGPAVEFSADGRRQAYAASRDGKWFMVIDGREGPRFHRVWLPVFSPDGNSVAYWADFDDGSATVILNGVRLKPRSTGSGHPPVFSPNGERLAYRAARNVGTWSAPRCETFVVVDGQAHPAFAGVSEPCFSADSQHIAYTAGTHDMEGGAMVIDGQPGPKYDWIFRHDEWTWRPQFTDAGAVEYLARRGDAIYRVI